ncbi:MAG: hypothetical protein ACYDC1_04525 [Limisphaerales bacterium]
MADIVQVNTRKFLREFPSMKELAASGACVRVVEGGQAWHFTLETHKPGFLGATKGTLLYQAPPEQLFSTGQTWEAEQ